MTLKQERLVKELRKKENFGKPLIDIAEKVGYSRTAGNIYNRTIKSHIQKVFTEQGITKNSLKEAYSECLELCRKKEDYATLKSTIDSLAKLFGHLKDSSLTQAFLFNDVMQRDLPKDKIDNITDIDNKLT